MGDLSLLEIISEDKYAISYRPKFTALCDSALAAILLQEMIYFWKQKEGKPFYKFKDACDHDLYRDNDSWCETLGFNKHEFDAALKVIGTKISKGISKKTVLDTEYPVRQAGESDQDFYTRFTKALSACVIYWTDRNRLTWYQVNETLLCKFVDGIYISKNNGARYLKSSILAFRNKKAWDERRKDSTKVPAKETKNDSLRFAIVRYFAPALVNAVISSAPKIVSIDGDTATYDEWLNELATIFDTAAASAMLKNWYNVFKGRAAKGKWQEANITPAATLDEVKRWHHYEIRESLKANGPRINPHTQGKFVTALNVNDRFLRWRTKAAAIEAEKQARAELERVG